MIDSISSAIIVQSDLRTPPRVIFLFVDKQLHFLNLRGIRGFQDVYPEDLGRDRVEGPAESAADAGRTGRRLAACACP